MAKIIDISEADIQKLEAKLEQKRLNNMVNEKMGKKAKIRLKV